MPASPLPTTDDAEFLTRAQAAAQTLREAIISGELASGDRILEQHWSTRLGIGQPTLREAMRELEYQGLLRRTRQRGTYVATLGADDYRQIMEVRVPLEAMAIELAAERLTPEVEQELIAIVDVMAGTLADKDTRRFHDCDVLFHRKIWESTGNPYLQHLLETLSFRLFVFSVVGRWPDSPNSTAEWKAAIAQHVGILQGIRTRDSAAARDAFIGHTVAYWNDHYDLALRHDAPPSA